MSFGKTAKQLSWDLRQILQKKMRETLISNKAIKYEAPLIGAKPSQGAFHIERLDKKRECGMNAKAKLSN
ncbi:hypothetical protein ACI2OX_21080 [Bacillus sp. N9]